MEFVSSCDIRVILWAVVGLEVAASSSSESASHVISSSSFGVEAPKKEQD